MGCAMRALAVSCLLSLLLAPACGGTVTSPSTLPGWVVALIAQFQSAPVGNPPQSIYRYTYKGQTVYYVPPQCCDQYSTLYDAGGQVLCAPDGGIDGRGDGKCPGFLQERTDGALVWRDSR